MKKLYKFDWDGQYAIIGGLFISEESDVESAIGKEIYLGEVSGKHSEVIGTLDKEDLTIISESKTLIDLMESAFDGTHIFGYNPLDYTEEALQ
jgi:hypothetical protein